MKVLYIENMVLGHHVPYVQALADTDKYDSAVVTPQKIDEVKVPQFVFSKMDFESKKLKDYSECIDFILKTAQQNNVDIVHFLDGDKIMRYFGLGMNKISRKIPVVITYHHLFGGLVRKISYKAMCTKRNPVVHTSEFKKALEGYGIKNVAHVEYPSFLAPSTQTAKNDVPVIGMYGGTRFDKGLDILIKSLCKVRSPFHLVIAGREADYMKSDIEKMCEPIKDRVTLDLRFLSENELASYWDKTDLVVLPYRAVFDGASGQLTEGVNRGLPIIGPSHGSLGEIIRNNHLGDTFATEDVDDLAEKIEAMLANGFEYDEVARTYQQTLTPSRFREDYRAIYETILK